MRITSLTLKIGNSEMPTFQKFDLKPITIFVGPNNSGKSLALREISQLCNNGMSQSSTNKLVTSASSVLIEEHEVKEVISRFERPPQLNTPPGYLIYGREHGTLVERSRLERILTTEQDSDEFSSLYLKHVLLNLNGQNRISLADQQPMGDLLDSKSSNHFQVLAREETKRLTVRRILLDAFGLYFTLNPVMGGTLRGSFNTRCPIDEVEELGFGPRALAYHSAGALVSELSDGLRSFTGIITQVVAGSPEVLLIDEPEAFLHPSLAFKLGQEVAQLMAVSKKNLFVSTHSVSFLMGCVQAGVPLNIVRLTYHLGSSEARVLDHGTLIQMMRNPLLRSAGVMNALFYENVVVCEADSDRAFYQEINERLLQEKSGRGIKNCLFLNAQNKQTIKTILGPLRNLGIRVAAIVDVDILKEGGNVWSSFLEAANVPAIDVFSLGTARSALMKRFAESPGEMKRDGGVALLSLADRESANNLFDRLQAYGLFTVRAGELESWFSEYPSSSHGPQWLVFIFEKLGHDPSSAGYVLPGVDGVWEFLTLVGNWLSDTNRMGMLRS